jgi:hypothetical protein
VRTLLYLVDFFKFHFTLGHPTSRSPDRLKMLRSLPDRHIPCAYVCCDIYLISNINLYRRKPAQSADCGRGLLHEEERLCALRCRRRARITRPVERACLTEAVRCCVSRRTRRPRTSRVMSVDCLKKRQRLRSGAGGKCASRACRGSLLDGSGTLLRVPAHETAAHITRYVGAIA